MAKKTLNVDDAGEMALQNNINDEKPLNSQNDLLILFTKRHVHSKSCGANTYHNYNQIFPVGTYTTDQELIKELIDSKANVELYKRVK